MYSSLLLYYIFGLIQGITVVMIWMTPAHIKALTKYLIDQKATSPEKALVLPADIKKLCILAVPIFNFGDLLKKTKDKKYWANTKSKYFKKYS